ncbi:1,2-phenylacetyl-CoA epoxidase subunit PaaC [Aeromicrobium sp.]|uniref:1,2-phenylacetyl-CoA epoxidase subunit PaaC n=1 Tax=Aeromicrobium sp. TaxID=1871063 RepID=UPI002FC9CF7A
MNLTLELADDALILSHRCSEWLTRSPEIELDIAFGNIGLDLLGQARSLYALVGDEDRLAYHRDAPEWRNCTLVELPNGDFAFSMMRLLAFASYECALFRTDPDTDELRAIFAKAAKEAAYHLEHAEAWVLRLGDGTDVSHGRMQDAADAVWPLLTELCSSAPEVEAAVRTQLAAILTAATLTVPTAAAPTQRGEHTPHLAELLGEMQSLAREHEGATW